MSDHMQTHVPSKDEPGYVPPVGTDRVKYRIDYDWKAEIRVEIDPGILNEERLREINDFFSGSAQRLEREGSVLNAVLKMLAKTCLYLQIETGLGTDGIIERFDWDGSCGGQEGWPKMDGSEGIRLLHVDAFDIDENDMTINRG